MNFYIGNRPPPRSLPLGETKEPGRDDDQDEVEDEESGQDESTPLPILVPDIQRNEAVLSDSMEVPTSGGIVD